MIHEDGVIHRLDNACLFGRASQVFVVFRHFASIETLLVDLLLEMQRLGLMDAGEFHEMARAAASSGRISMSDLVLLSLLPVPVPPPLLLLVVALSLAVKPPVSTVSDARRGGYQSDPVAQAGWGDDLHGVALAQTRLAQNHQHRRSAISHAGSS